MCEKKYIQHQKSSHIQILQFKLVSMSALEINSARVFNKLAGFSLAIKSFSVIHKSHFREPQIYGE